jgi:hypothetical protein
MPSLNVTVPHPFSQEEATDRLKRLLEMAKARNEGKVSNLVEEWTGNQLKFGFSTFGFNVSGAMDVEPQAVKIQATIPIAAMMFKGKIEQTLRDELTRVLT